MDRESIASEVILQGALSVFIFTLSILVVVTALFFIISIANSMQTKYLKRKYKKNISKYLDSKDASIVKVEAFNSRGIPTVVRIQSLKSKTEEIIAIF